VGFVKSSLAKITDPKIGLSKSPAIRKRVDFPEPIGPTTMDKFLEFNFMDILSRARISTPLTG
jgi:hypothetical protein